MKPIKEYFNTTFEIFNPSSLNGFLVINKINIDATKTITDGKKQFKKNIKYLLIYSFSIIIN